MRPRYLLGLLLLIPLVDSFVLVAIVGWGLLTWLQTIALVVLTGLLGMVLVRAEGRNTLARFQRKLAAGTPPTDELLDGGLLIAAGAFLLTPGLVTDLIGLLLVLPPTRYPIRMALKRWVVIPYIDKQTGGLGSGVAWTYGFPDPEDAAGGTGDDPFSGFDADGFDTGQFGGDGFSGGPSARTGSAAGTDAGAAGDTNAEDDIVDVNFERVDDDESRSTNS